METTATTFEWAILYMCLHADKQEKVYQEIVREIGDCRITMADKVCHTVFCVIQYILAATTVYDSRCPRSSTPSEYTSIELDASDDQRRGYFGTQNYRRDYGHSTDWGCS